MVSKIIVSTRSTARLILSCVVVLGLVASIVMGQETTGGISGTVIDASGAAIPGAKVDLAGGTPVRVVSTTSNANGVFNVGNLSVGVYTVTASAGGFATMKRTSVTVELGKVARVDFNMEVGQVTESVVIAADAVMVDTASSASQINVDKSFFDLMPKGRSFYDLVNLAPGARNEAKSGGYQVDGASGSENTFYLDGMEVTNVQTGVLSDQNKVPVEMVQQVQVKNGVMDAQYGGAMGGVVNAVVRSGSNQFHGQVGFYFNNDSLQARPRPTLQFDPTDGDQVRVRNFQNPQDSFRTWNPIVSIGGPIIKNKLFFFSGFMPSVTNTTRTVNFLQDDSTGTFKNKKVQQYMAHKLDFIPFSRVRVNMNWIWNPGYNRGVLPLRDGTDSPTNNWNDLGDYTSGNILSGQIDYLATNKLIFTFRGGYNYNNNSNRYAIPDATAIYYSNDNTSSPLNIPDDLRGSAGFVVAAVARTDYNIYKRVNLNADGSYILNLGGQHSLKFGWQTNRLSNSVKSLSYPNGYYRYYWGQSWTCITDQCSGRQTGPFGYYRYRVFGTFGDASSDNQGIFLQDSWKVSKRLTLNLGIRSEREFLPSFSVAGGVAAPPIEFPWSSKVSPRLGFAYDPKGDGKIRIYGSWGWFYDTMKYEMPRGSFGGDIWVDYYYSLNDPNWVRTNQGVPANPLGLQGTFFEAVNNRIPSNDPNNNTVDPNLKPMKQQMFDFGFDYSINPTMVGSVRYTNRRLIRTIEDVGTLSSAGEVYYIANPGFGLVADPATWDPGFPTTPKAKRNYDAVEFRVDKRFSRSYQFVASYTWSRSFGNYSGLASSDENGRTSPNVNRYFDLPWISYNEQGHIAEGRLGTDRPHTFKFFGGYTLRSKLGSTTFAPSIALYSGTPLTTNVNVISTTPAYPYGRGDLGRTPFFHNFDFNIMHDFTPFKQWEATRIRFEFTVFNLFNSGTVTDKAVNLVHPADGQLQFDNEADFFKGWNAKQMIADQFGRTDPTFGLANAWQAPRSARLQLSFIF